MREVVVRPIGPADRHALRVAFGRLSPASRHARWHGVKRELDDHEVEALVAMDGWHRHGVIAWAPERHLPVGFASCIRTGRFWVGEVAVAVVDEWQSAGVGTALVDALLASARRAGIDTLVAATQLDNHRARRLIRRVGAPRCARAEAGVLEVEVSATGPAPRHGLEHE